MWQGAFYGQNRKLHDKILNRKPVFPTYLSGTSCNFIKKLLQRNPERRLGSQKSTMFETRGTQELKNHSFFQGTNWVHVFERRREAPHVPTVNGELDTSNFDEEFTRASVLDSPKPSFKDPNQTEKTGSPSKLFRGFSWQDESFMDMHFKRERGNSRAEIAEDAIDDAGGDGTITVEDMGSLELPQSAASEKKGDVTGVEKKILMKLCSICLEERPESEYSRSQIKRGPRRVCKICIRTNRTRPVNYTPNAKTANNDNDDDKQGKIDADANAGDACSREENKKEKDNSKDQMVTSPSPSTLSTTTSVDVQITLENQLQIL